MKKFLPIAAIALLALAGCTSAPTNDSSAPKTTTQSQTETPMSSEPESIKIGNPVTVGDWEITINSWNPDVNAEVEAASPDMFTAPDAGKAYALMNVTMKYTGTGTGDNSGVQIQYVPDSAGTVSKLWSAYGATPGENKLTYETLTPGGEITGDALYLIDAGTTGKFEIYVPSADEPAVVIL